MEAATVTDHVTITGPHLLRLMQLSSASLPVGGYAFSQGLELAIDKGWITNVAQTQQWLELQMHDAIARVDLPIMDRVYASVEQATLSGSTDIAHNISHWNEMVLACRETREMRLSDTAMGEALVRLLPKLNVPLPVLNLKDVSFVVMFAWAACHWQIPLAAAKLGYTWSWLENQIAAATKLVPLGQTHAQQLMIELQTVVPDCIALSAQLEDEELGASLPALAIASALHEVQYTRLFRS